MDLNKARVKKDAESNVVVGMGTAPFRVLRLSLGLLAAAVCCSGIASVAQDNGDVTTASSVTDSDDDESSSGKADEAPLWAKEAQSLLDSGEYESALVSLGALKAAHFKDSWFHIMSAEAWYGIYEKRAGKKDEITALRQARDSLLKAKAWLLVEGDGEDEAKEIDELLESVTSVLNETKAAAPQSALSAKPAPALKLPNKTVAVKTSTAKPAPVQAPATSTRTSDETSNESVSEPMPSNLPLTLPGAASRARFFNARAAQIIEKNRKYPTFKAYEELVEIYLKAGMFAEAAQVYRTQADLYRRMGKLEAATIQDTRAARYETQIRLFVDRKLTSTELSTLNTGAPLEPPVGTYIGAFIDRDDQLKDVWVSEYGQQHRKAPEFASLVGKPHSSYFMYLAYKGKGIFPRKWLEHCKSAGVIPHIAWEPDDLNEVQDDAYLRNFAQECNKLNWPIFLRYASEMNGSWTKWHGNPKLYREKFRLVHRVFKKYAPQVATVWCPNSTPVDTILDYYPGDDACDWVGINLYSVPFYDNDLKKPAEMDTPISFIDPIYNMFADRKPIAICEYASSQKSSADNVQRTGFAIDKMSQLYSALPRLYPRIKLIDWFSMNTMIHAKEGRRLNNYNLTENKAVLDAYRSQINSPYYISADRMMSATRDNVSRPMPRAVTLGQTVNGAANFSIWVKTYVARPKVYLQVGKQVVYAGMRPGAHVARVDVKKMPQGRQPVTVLVYDDKNRFISSSSTTMNFGRSRGTQVEPLKVSGMVQQYLFDRSGLVSAVEIQTPGSLEIVHFAPDMAQQLMNEYSIKGRIALWVSPNANKGARHWNMVGVGDVKPASFISPYETEEVALLQEPYAVPTDAESVLQNGKITNVVTDRSGEVVALVVNNTTLVMVPKTMRSGKRSVDANASDGNATNRPMTLSRNSSVEVTGTLEAPRIGAVSSYEKRIVATDIIIGDTSVAETGIARMLPLQAKLFAVGGTTRTRGGSSTRAKTALGAKAALATGLNTYQTPLPTDTTTRGGSRTTVKPLMGRKQRPW